MSAGFAAADVVRYETRGGAAWVTLDRPGAMNALAPAVIDGVNAALDRAECDRVRAVVIGATGPVFCAGADLKALCSLLPDAGAVTEYVEAIAGMVNRVAACTQPVIAAVQGAAIAGGLELVLACDLVVAADTATFSDGHARYGLVPGAGSGSRLPRLIGATRAKWLLFTADSWSAEAMRDCGLVNQVVAAERLDAAVEALTATLAARSADGLRRMKRMVDQGRDLSLSEALQLELREFAAHAAGDDLGEGVAAFAEKRTPRFGPPRMGLPADGGAT